MLNRRALLKSAAFLTASSSMLPRALLAQDTAQRASPLLTKAIPSTGETLPVVGIGTNHYGHGIGEGKDAELIAPLRETIAKYAEMGGRMIDTSTRYGESENVLGGLIDELGLNEHFFISTKVSSDDPIEAAEQIAQSTQRLKSGTLDIVSLHNLRGWQNNLSMLREAKQEGKIRYYGLSTADIPQYDELVGVIESESLDFIQVNYSLSERFSEDKVLKAATENGVAVVANRGFNRGQLFEDVSGHDVPEWAAEFDASSWGQVFLKYVVSHPAITCTIPGTTKVHHLIDNLGAAQGRLPTAEQRKQIEDYYTEIVG